MSELILFAVIVVQSAVIAYLIHSGRQERKEWTFSLIAKNPFEYKVLEEKVAEKEKVGSYVPQPDLVPESSLDDAEWFKAIGKEAKSE